MNFQDDNLSQISISKPKGHAIPGVDYGLDMVDEKPKSENGSANNSERASPSLVASSKPVHQPQSFHNVRRSQPQSQYFMNNNQQQGSQSASDLEDDNDDEDGSIDLGSDDASDEAVGLIDNQSGFQQYPGIGLQMEQQHQREPTYEEIRKRKIDGVAAYRRLKAAGYVAAGERDLTMSSDLSEIEDTVERLQAQRELDNSIKWQRKMLVGFATVVENVCKMEQYNIFDLQLDGWSESIFDNIDEYDDVFEELHYKYKDKVSTPPELRLLGMVAGSAWMFHMSKSAFNKAANVPGFNDVMQSNPNLRRQYQETAMNMNTSPNQVSNLMQSFMPSQQQQQQQPQVAAQQQQPIRPQIQQQQQQLPMTPRAPPRQAMEDPDDVDGLLNSLTGGNMETEDELDLSELDNLSDL